MWLRIRCRVAGHNSSFLLESASSLSGGHLRISCAIGTVVDSLVDVSSGVLLAGVETKKGW